MMNNTIQQILIVAIAIVNVFLVGIVYQQGQALARLEGHMATLSAETSLSQAVSLAESNKSRVKELVEGENSITGIIKSVSADTLVVEAVVADAVALGKVDPSRPFTVQQIKKTYQVKITSMTSFTHKKLSELVAGDMVHVSAPGSVLTVDTFIAKEVSSVDLAQTTKTSKK